MAIGGKWQDWLLEIFFGNCWQPGHFTTILITRILQRYANIVTIILAIFFLEELCLRTDKHLICLKTLRNEPTALLYDIS